ncbi:hypothetical protein [Nonomuraea typhae]|uniref:Uncharacterized protein n=1 Tax=Nonomuraea typhae TaxID=2603600 RepID=A0ABW7ZAE4_9ACTN
MEEHGPAADKALRLVIQGALVGPAGTELYNSLVEQRDLVRNAFTAAFLTVQRMAREDAQPVPQLPDVHTATAPPPSSVRGRIGGDPDLLTALANELRTAGGDLQDTGQALAVRRRSPFSSSRESADFEHHRSSSPTGSSGSTIATCAAAGPSTEARRIWNINSS